MCIKFIFNGHMEFDKFCSSLGWYSRDSKIYAHFMEKYGSILKMFKVELHDNLYIRINDYR